ncbi:hypothetical protein LPJ53_001921 [Coemansia erecta]|uniref:Myb-like domain-containing protein n=1 Tax=Coemansia erecta TaxID=147472 RepID=A0A9W7Y3W5_9FUNG|nr:hypothetical protein LPJ53_001921 [Coemansia erecta]
MQIPLELVYRVGYAARKHYSTRTCRVNWEKVSKELRIPVLGCLECFDARQAGIPPRRLSESHEWPIEDIVALKQFTEANFQHMSVYDWELSGKYINIDHSDCIAKMWAVSKFQMSPMLFDEITDYRQAGLLWPTICHKTMCGCPPDILRVAYMSTNRSKVSKVKRPKAQFSISKHQHWTKEEDNKLVELLLQYDNKSDVDWNFISKTIGHSKNACRYRRILLRPRLKERQSADAEDNLSDTLTSASSRTAGRGTPV